MIKSASVLRKYNDRTHKCIPQRARATSHGVLPARRPRRRRHYRLTRLRPCRHPRLPPPPPLPPPHTAPPAAAARHPPPPPPPHTTSPAAVPAAPAPAAAAAATTASHSFVSEPRRTPRRTPRQTPAAATTTATASHGFITDRRRPPCCAPRRRRALLLRQPLRQRLGTALPPPLRLVRVGRRHPRAAGDHSIMV